MDISNIFKTAENKMSIQIAKNTEIRKINQSIENYISRIIDYIGEENRYIANGFTYGSTPNCLLSETDKKELVNTLITKVKELPEKLKAELDKFFEGMKLDTEEEKETPEAEDESTPKLTVTKELIARPIFNY